MASVVLGKRKRPVVSYFEGDEGAESETLDAVLHQSDDESGSYGSKQTASTSRASAKKKTKKSKNASKKKAPPAFRFLDLPPELRNIIYSFALTEEGGIQLVSARTKNRRTVRMDDVRASDEKVRPRSFRSWQRVPRARSKDYVRPQLVPALLRVNQQIHQEASDLLYSHPFILADVTALHSFLAVIGRKNRLLLKDVTLREYLAGYGTKAGNHAALTLLADCTNLRTIYFDCTVVHHGEPSKLAKQLYRDGHIFLETYGYAHGAKDAGIAVLSLKQLESKDANRWWSSTRGDSRNLQPEALRGIFEAQLRDSLGCRQ
ncbi:hypothetical protein MBLNU230_g3075t1 [Neophaeotheca triangularis]